MPFALYLHVSTATGKVYVGQTRRGIETRWRQHVRTALADASRAAGAFARAIRKYGAEAWEHSVLEVVESQDEANAAEVQWIAFYKADQKRYGYNLDAGGTAKNTHPDTVARISASQRRRFQDPEQVERLRRSHLGEVHSPETIARRAAALKAFHAAHPAAMAAVRRAQTTETHAKRSASLKAAWDRDPTLRERCSPRGRVRSSETREKIRQRAIGREHSADTKKRMSAAARGRSNAVATARSAEANRGKPRPPEVIAKIKETKRLRRLALLAASQS